MITYLLKRGVLDHFFMDLKRKRNLNKSNKLQI